MKIFLRLANETDESRLLEWRNDERIRSMFFQPEIVAHDVHSEWFRNTILTRKSLCFLGFEVPSFDSPGVGYCRFDPVGVRFFEVSILISPDKQGKGLAGLLLAEACSELKNFVATPVRLIAKVKEDNPRSVRLFESAGFKASEVDTESIKILEKNLI